MPSAELLSRENNVARIRVTLDQESVSTAFSRVYKDLGRNLRIPGFRQGKVPPNIVRQRVGVENVAAEVSDRLKETAISHALAELELTPRYGQTKWEQEPLAEEGKEVIYEFALPVLPKVTLPDYRSFQIDVSVPEINDELRQKYVDRLMQQFTEVVDKPETAAEGDVVLIDIHSHFAEDGSAAPFHGHGINYILGQEGNLPGWDERLTGSTAGTSLEFDYTMPEDYSDDTVASRELKVQVKVEAVKTVIKPELSAEFLEEKLHMGSREEFDGFVENALRKEVSSQLNQAKAEQAMRRLVEVLEAELTEDMIDEELDGILQQQDQELRSHGIDLQKYLQDTGKSLGDHRASLRDSAIGKIKFFLAIKAISDAENFEVSRDDYMRYAYYVMQREGLDSKQMKQVLSDRRFINEASYQVIREKVLNHVVGSVAFNIHDPNAPAEAAEPRADTEA